jgi:hypothetical protein
VRRESAALAWNTGKFFDKTVVGSCWLYSKVMKAGKATRVGRWEEPPELNSANTVEGNAVLEKRERLAARSPIFHACRSGVSRTAVTSSRARPANHRLRFPGALRRQPSPVAKGFGRIGFPLRAWRFCRQRKSRPGPGVLVRHFESWPSRRTSHALLPPRFSRAMFPWPSQSY